MRRIQVLLLAAVAPLLVQAYTLPDSLSLERCITYDMESLISRSWAPFALLGAGIVYGNSIPRYLDSSSNSSSHDLIMYTPAAAMLGTMVTLKLTGTESRSDWTRALTVGAMSLALETGTVQLLKHFVDECRPDVSGYDAFPSGHTATAFATATMLHHEYGQTVSPWFSVAGYGLAGLTGLQRLAADRHWYADVCAGAGIGIFTTELAYSLGDLIFKDRHLCRDYQRKEKDLYRWQFGLTSHYSFKDLSGGNRGISDLQPGSSIGLDAHRLIGEHFGAVLEADITQLRFAGDSKDYNGDSSPFSFTEAIPYLFSCKAGIEGAMQPVQHLKLYGTLTAGPVWGHNYEMMDYYGFRFQSDLPEFTFGARAKAGLAITTSNCTSVGAFIGLDYIGNYAALPIAGTTVNLYF